MPPIKRSTEQSSEEAPGFCVRRSEKSSLHRDKLGRCRTVFGIHFRAGYDHRPKETSTWWRTQTTRAQRFRSASELESGAVQVVHPRKGCTNNGITTRQETTVQFLSVPAGIDYSSDGVFTSCRHESANRIAPRQSTLFRLARPTHNSDYIGRALRRAVEPRF